MDLKQNAFLRQWINYKKPLSLGKANNFSLHSLNRGFAPHQHCKYKHFFTINAQLEYYFFNYKGITFLTGGRKWYRDFNLCYRFINKKLKCSLI